MRQDYGGLGAVDLEATFISIKSKFRRGTQHCPAGSGQLDLHLIPIPKANSLRLHFCTL